jgi:hypothetical protein
MIGVKSMQPRAVSIQRIVILPLFFLAMSLYGLYEKFILGFPSLIPFWMVFLAVGAYFGMREVRSWHLHVDRHKGLITIPGNYSTLVLIILIFVLKFFWGYFYAAHTEVSYKIYLADISTSSLVTGFFVGRAWFFSKRYMQSKNS